VLWAAQPIGIDGRTLLAVENHCFWRDAALRLEAEIQTVVRRRLSRLGSSYASDVPALLR
jgi:hypothetical protein